MKAEKQNENVCINCIHYFACASWNVGSIASMERNHCENFEKEDTPVADVPKWISCKDRMPDIGVSVLTLDKWNHIHDRKLKSYSSGVMLFSPDGLVPIREILYWMPLPQPPKGA